MILADGQFDFPHFIQQLHLALPSMIKDKFWTDPEIKEAILDTLIHLKELTEREHLDRLDVVTSISDIGIKVDRDKVLSNHKDDEPPLCKGE